MIFKGRRLYNIGTKTSRKPCAYEKCKYMVFYEGDSQSYIKEILYHETD